MYFITLLQEVRRNTSCNPITKKILENYSIIITKTNIVFWYQQNTWHDTNWPIFSFYYHIFKFFIVQESAYLILDVGNKYIPSPLQEKNNPVSFQQENALWGRVVMDLHTNAYRNRIKI